METALSVRFAGKGLKAVSEAIGGQADKHWWEFGGGVATIIRLGKRSRVFHWEKWFLRLLMM